MHFKPVILLDLQEIDHWLKLFPHHLLTTQTNLPTSMSVGTALRYHVAVIKSPSVVILTVMTATTEKRNVKSRNFSTLMLHIIEMTAKASGG